MATAQMQCSTPSSPTLEHSISKNQAREGHLHSPFQLDPSPDFLHSLEHRLQQAGHLDPITSDAGPDTDRYLLPALSAQQFC